jgi:hypothetical protein
MEGTVETQTHKLDKGTVNVFGNVTDVMLYWYIGLYAVIYWFDRALIGIQLVQFAFPMLVLVPIHFVVVAFLELPWANRVQAAFRFGFFTADRYVISIDPNPLIHVIPRPEPDVEAKTRNLRHPARQRKQTATKEARA